MLSVFAASNMLLMPDNAAKRKKWKPIWQCLSKRRRERNKLEKSERRSAH